MRTTSVCGAQLYTYCKFKNYLEVNHCPKRNHMNPLCLQTDWVNFMQILCLFEILTQTYMKQPLIRGTNIRNISKKGGVSTQNNTIF